MSQPITFEYAVPPSAVAMSDCEFYHTMDLPGHGLVEGEWDLRGRAKDYLGQVNFHNKRVLEVGPASGSLSFDMEKMGAEVVAFDLDKNLDTDIVPMSRCEDLKKAAANHRGFIHKVQNSFWFAHKAMQSNVKVAYGHAYNIPRAIGPVDIATFGSILLHMQNPFQAL